MVSVGVVTGSRREKHISDRSLWMVILQYTHSNELIVTSDLSILTEVQRLGTCTTYHTIELFNISCGKSNNIFTAHALCMCKLAGHVLCADICEYHSNCKQISLNSCPCSLHLDQAEWLSVLTQAALCPRDQAQQVLGWLHWL